jgi:Protein of unknown function (DUF4236)
MSWRFRKVFKLFPGFKLNLTPRGISATAGAAPLSVNVGPRGVYRNLSIPGTGVWDRQRIDIPSKPQGLTKLEMLERDRRIMVEYAAARTNFNRLTMDLFDALIARQEQGVELSAEKFAAYRATAGAYFVAARNLENYNGRVLSDSLRAEFCCWIGEMEAALANWDAQLTSGEAAEAFVRVLTGPRDIAEEFMSSLADELERKAASA